ncbi:MAG: hypothetical protein Q4G63_03640 [Bacteroidia bacterium]|nr:hypothetical protein [Bacteroidia bacterium]
MIRLETLEADCFYHIFNRGVNGENVFIVEDNYLFFLQKIKSYLLPVADVYAYCLMPNHFHLVLRIKSEKALKTLSKSETLTKVERGLHSESAIVSKQIGKLISSYTQAFNKFHNRHGNLFESPFKRKRIETDEHLQQVILYVHQNSWALGLNLANYPYSSYRSILSNAKTEIIREEVIELFNNIENFKYCHLKEVIL